MARLPQKVTPVQHSKGFTIQLCLITDDVNLGLDHLIKTVSTGFFHCKVTVFSFLVPWERYFEIIQISYFSNFHPLTSAYICGTCMQQLYMWGLANDNVLFLAFTLNPLTGTVHREELSLFLHLFIQLFTYTVWIHILPWVITEYYHYFMLQTLGAPWGWALPCFNQQMWP